MQNMNNEADTAPEINERHLYTRRKDEIGYQSAKLCEKFKSHGPLTQFEKAIEGSIQESTWFDLMAACYLVNMESKLWTKKYQECLPVFRMSWWTTLAGRRMWSSLTARVWHQLKDVKGHKFPMDSLNRCPLFEFVNFVRECGMMQCSIMCFHWSRDGVRGRGYWFWKVAARSKPASVGDGWG